MENRFYIKSKKEKYKIQFLIGLAAFFIVLSSVYVAWITSNYFIIPFIFMIVVSVIAPFFDVPSMVAQGNLTYHSLLFLSEKPKNGVLKIHGGTLFDYVFVVNRKMNGKQRTDFIIRQFLQGFLKLIDECKDSENNNLLIRGTSYIINRKTATNMGFKVVETDFIQKLLLICNYVNILLSYSIAKGKLSFPNLSQTITFEITFDRLIKKEAYIRNLYDRL